MQIANRADQLVLIRDGVDAVEFSFDWLNALLVDRCLIHAGGVEVANLLRDRVSTLRESSLVENVVQERAVVFSEFSEASPARLVRRDGVVLAPSSAGVLVEVLTGIDGFVHRVKIVGLRP